MGSTAKPKKRFKDRWVEEYPELSTWLRRIPGSDYGFFCFACKRNFRGGLSEIEKHADSKAHCDKAAVVSSQHVPVTLQCHSADDSDLLVHQTLAAATPYRNSMHENSVTQLQPTIRNKKRFQSRWLQKDPSLSWVQPVPEDDSLFFCVPCDKSFACGKAEISKHAKTVKHLNNVAQAPLSKAGAIQASSPKASEHLDDASAPPAKRFQFSWFDSEPSWREWVHPVKGDNSKFFCSFCNVVLNCGYSEIAKHSETVKHTKVMSDANATNNRNAPANAESADESETIPFWGKVKRAEIRLAAFIVEHNLSFDVAPYLLGLIKAVGGDPHVLEKMTLGPTKCTNIVKNVLYVEESRRIGDNLRHSNAAAERLRSLLPDIKTKKRNQLKYDTVNALCTVKTALKARNETAVNMKITSSHLELMDSNVLYAKGPSKVKS